MRTINLVLVMSLGTAYCGQSFAQSEKVDAAEKKIPQRVNLYIEAVRDGCSAGNPLYRIRGNQPTMSLKVCKFSSQPGTASRKFTDYSIANGETVTLGCGVEGGATDQDFSIHWQEADPAKAPADVTAAANDLMFYSVGCSGGNCSWFISNRHYFKDIDVNYTFRGQIKQETVTHQTDLILLGISPTGPVVNRAVFIWPYPESAACLATGDQYPTIPVVNGP